MTQKIFTIMGSTGHVGQVIVDDLLKRGHIVRALGRDEKKLHQLEMKGAIPFVIDAKDSDALTQAFHDAYAVFSFIPPGYNTTDFGTFQDTISKAIVDALNNTNVQRVVNLSSMGAELAGGTGLIKGLHRHEERLNTLKQLKTCVHLRAGFFMDNLNAFIPIAIEKGVIRSMINAKMPIAMVATRDIGWKVADLLDSSASLQNLVFYFVGPREVTMEDVAFVLGKCLDQPEIKYQEITLEEEKKGMLEAGLSPNFVDLVLEMYKGFNAGLIQAPQDLKRTHHGITTLEEYLPMTVHHMFAHVRA